MHSPTLLVVLAVLLGIMTLIQAAAWFFGRRIPAMLFWTGAYLAAFLSSINFLTRGAQFEWLMVVGSQMTQFLTAYLMLMGARSYIGLPVWPARYGFASLAVISVLSVYFLKIDPQQAIRLSIASLVIGSLFAWCAWTMARGGLRRYPARYLFAVPCCVHALFVFARIAIVFHPDGQAINLVRIESIPPVLVLEGIVSLVILAFTTLMLVNESINAELRTLAEIDPLTSSFNRRSFLSLLDKALSAAGRRQAPLSILLIDLDHFKQINDQHGHQTGDAALRHFVGLSTACLRNEDVLGRIGGEEFAVFLPNIALGEAQLIAERLRKTVAEQLWPDPVRPISLSVSIGVAESQPGELVENLLHRADKAMYRAKAAGRNRVESWDLNYAV